MGQRYGWSPENYWKDILSVLIQFKSDLLDISMEEVMAIGDSWNDLLLIQATDWITDTNEQDGVAKAITRYLLV